MDAFETKLHQKLAKQLAALEQTKKEITFYENAVHEHPNAVTLVNQAQTKMRRQELAVKATQLAIELYTTPPAKKR